jgi:uncharacterized membrane protein YphA (DoxX/SURF4 family)
LQNIFAVDYRSLALFRVSLGSVLLFDLISRFIDLKAFYSDEGVLPRSLLLENMNKWFSSIHMLSGAWQVQALLFSIHIVFCLMLIFGFKTRLSLFLSWFLLISVQTRNPYILNGGDIVIRCLLFWSLFLPLGERFSIDTIIKPIQSVIRSTHISICSVAILLQVFSLYFFSVFHKSGTDWREDYTATFYALSVEQFSTSFGQFLLNFPTILQLVTISTLLLEYFGVIVVFSPFFTKKIRLFIIPLFLLLHISIATTMKIGIFPFVCMVAWTLFIPSTFWEYLRTSGSGSLLKVVYDRENRILCLLSKCILEFFFIPKIELSSEDTTYIKKIGIYVVDHKRKIEGVQETILFLIQNSRNPIIRYFPKSLIERILTNTYKKFSSQNNPTLESCTSRSKKNVSVAILKNLFVVFLLINVVIWNVRNLDYDYYSKTLYPEKYNWILEIFRLDQHWGMFAPFPMKHDGWFIISGKLKDGRTIDLRTEHPVTDVKPKLISNTIPNARWSRYLHHVYETDHDYWKKYFAHYVYKKWNSSHRGNMQVESVNIYFWDKFNYYNSEPKFEKRLLTSYP